MKKLRTIDKYLCALILISICTIGLRTYALLNCFNRATMHFNEPLTFTIGAIICAVGALFFLTYFFFGDKERELIAKSDNAATYIPSGIVSAALLFMAVEILPSMEMMNSTNESVILLRRVSIIGAILALLSVISFFLCIFIDKRGDVYKAAFSLSIVLFLAVYSMYLFFNKETHPTNSPNKIIDQMAYLCSAVYFLFESRIHLGRAKWRAYVTFGLIATELCLFSSIPSLINYAVDGYVVADTITESVLTLSLAVLMGSRVIQSRNLTPNDQCSQAKGIEALAAHREEEIEQMRKLERAHINNNVENSDTQDASNYTFDIPYVNPTPDYNPDGADIDINRGRDSKE